ncbi:MAG: glycine zipper family protein [Waterburya sp.]
MPKKLILTIGVIGLIKFIIGLSSDTVSAQSASYCEEYARDYAKRNSKNHTLGDAAGGAAGGALFGAILGDAGGGAAIGAIAGGIGGASKESADYQNLYNLAYRDCIQGQTPQNY